ncbi:unnamed protein product [Mesocestoides corti]|uniref:Uncharacterized protein n=1 Tax=Mesocestoides corti TaxID=53468 RepID=A0A0R3UP54_MESCO|nr:unnamed protein product [Mesocestoides corti]
MEVDNPLANRCFAFPKYHARVPQVSDFYPCVLDSHQLRIVRTEQARHSEANHLRTKRSSDVFRVSKCTTRTAHRVFRALIPQSGTENWGQKCPAFVPDTARADAIA